MGDLDNKYILSYLCILKNYWSVGISDILETLTLPITLLTVAAKCSCSHTCSRLVLLLHIVLICTDAVACLCVPGKTVWGVMADLSSCFRLPLCCPLEAPWDRQRMLVRRLNQIQLMMATETTTALCWLQPPNSRRGKEAIMREYWEKKEVKREL